MKWKAPTGRTLPKRTGGVTRIAGDRYLQFDDGSLRRETPKVKGKAAVKAAKRARQQRRRAAQVIREMEWAVTA
jgi:hypothetical protein